MSKHLDPRGLIKEQTSTKTLLIQPFFDVAKSENDETPLLVFGKFSRFCVTAIDTTADVKAATHNISMGGGGKPNEYAVLISGLMYGKRIAEEFYFGERKKSESESLGKAYSQQLFAAPFKGKTPAAVLNEDPANRAKLLNLYKVLKENADKYKTNRDQMDAIQEAVTLYDKGELKADQSNSSVIKLYDSGFKPNIYKSDENGLTPVTEMRVMLYPGTDYPFEFVLENYKAPVTKNDAGAINVVKSKKTAGVTHNFRLSYAGICGVIDEMKRCVNSFSITHFLGCEKDSLSLEEKAREEARSGYMQ